MRGDRPSTKSTLQTLNSFARSRELGVQLEVLGRLEHTSLPSLLAILLLVLFLDLLLRLLRLILLPTPEIGFTVGALLYASSVWVHKTQELLFRPLRCLGSHGFREAVSHLLRLLHHLLSLHKKRVR